MIWIFLSRKWYPFGQVSVSTFNLYAMMNFNHEDPRKKSPESAFIIFLLSAFVKIMQQKTYVIFWCEKMILASNLLNSTYFVTWFLQKQKKRDEKSWTITLDFFWDSLCLIKIHQLKTPTFFGIRPQVNKNNSLLIGILWTGVKSPLFHLDKKIGVNRDY